jgi:hypothetical protein
MINLRGHHLDLLLGYLLARKNKFSFKNKKDAILKAAVEDGHSRKHGMNVLEILEKALNPLERINLIDEIDDICFSCNYKSRRKCREFIPYGESAASADRGALHFYRLRKRVYTSGFIQAKLRKSHPYD